MTEKNADEVANWNGEGGGRGGNQRKIFSGRGKGIGGTEGHQKNGGEEGHAVVGAQPENGSPHDKTACKQRRDGDDGEPEVDVVTPAQRRQPQRHPFR